MVLLIIIPIKWLFHWEYSLFFRQTQKKTVYHIFGAMKPYEAIQFFRINGIVLLWPLFAIPTVYGMCMSIPFKFLSGVQFRDFCNYELVLDHV